MDRSIYQTPLVERYASREMIALFSPNFRFRTWRRLWIALAEAEKRAGIDISEEQIDEMRANIDPIDYAFAKQKEKELRHDVMAHVHTFARACPKAGPIIHLGATSAYVVDNTDLIQIQSALKFIHEKLLTVVKHLADFAQRHRDLPTLGYTHFQPAQLTTVGKRACSWIQEFLLDHEEVQWIRETLPFRGVKGTTGTQASFLELCRGDTAKVKAINDDIRRQFGFDRDLPITGQTYTRKLDYRVISGLSSIAQSATKFAGDLRLLAGLKEMDEPFEEKQVGSSAMAYKRNPIRSERISSLSRYLMALPQTMAYTASTQWFERTLDDSANKRLVIPQAFLSADAILNLYENISTGMVVYEKGIERNLRRELPFIITENLIMEGVRAGGDRQKLHEEIRILSMQASERVKVLGLDNDLVERLARSNIFPLDRRQLEDMMDPKRYIGRAAEMVDEFIAERVAPLLENFKEPNPVEMRV